MVKCPKCGSDDVDHATIGIAGAVQCVDCGHVFAYTEWPFPTSLVKKPLNDVPVKIDGLKDAQEAPL